MLTRDISLSDSINDLVDNCIDGALRIRDGGGFENLWVRIDANNERFVISDNCGGIPADLARNYAFHFGRPAAAEKIAHSIGQFGVGMKRSLFKLGKRFVVDSTSSVSHFVVEVNVDEWRNEPDWIFRFKVLEETTQPVDKHGTVITVTQLNEGVATELGLENYRSQLAELIGTKHQRNIERGLEISLNGIPVNFRAAELLSSDLLMPAYRSLEFPYPGDQKVSVRIWAGIIRSEQPRDPRLSREAGWYVFCNGRMILKADQTITTGWGEKRAGQRTTENDADVTERSLEESVKVPKYHPQFSLFRGYVFFDCDDGSLLPWTTTKTDVDEDSPLYKHVREVMITLMRPIIDFLNKLDAEIQTSGGPLTDAVEAASYHKLGESEYAQVFTSPETGAPTGPVMRRISYSKPVEEIELVKSALQVYTNREVGEKTFDYFLKREVGQ